MKEKVFNNKDFNLTKTVTVKGDTIICGTFENGWREFGSPYQRWHYPKRIVMNKVGNAFLEIFEIKVSSFKTEWVLVLRKKIRDVELLEQMIESYKTLSEYDNNIFLNQEGEN